MIPLRWRFREPNRERVETLCSAAENHRNHEGRESEKTCKKYQIQNKETRYQPENCTQTRKPSSSYTHEFPTGPFLLSQPPKNKRIDGPYFFCTRLCWSPRYSSSDASRMSYSSSVKNASSSSSAQSSSSPQSSKSSTSSSTTSAVSDLMSS